ncbi:MAG: DUF2752 domain-containing protein [Ilumatobacter sp.]
MTSLDAVSTTEVRGDGLTVRRSFWRAASKPVAVAALATAAVVTVGVRDPHAAGNYPSCPSIALFGVHCPGCGSMRAMHEFAHADIAGVLSRNILVPVGLVLLAWAWVAWFDRRLGHSRVPQLRPPVPVLYGSIVVLVAFAVLRNLPYSPFSGLAP